MRSILLDANLLVLFVVGTAEPSYISKHKRLSAFSEADFDLLLEIMSPFQNVYVTPNILTEASNLLAQTHEKMKADIFVVYRALIANFHEQFIQSSEASSDPEFIRLGLSDAAVLLVNSSPNVLLTSDFGLYRAALERGQDAVNFNHEREAAGTV